MRWVPLPIDFLLEKHGLKNTNFQVLLGIWIFFIVLSLSAVFYLVGYSSSLSTDKLMDASILNYVMFQVPVFLSIMLVFWLGFEWGFIPVFLSAFMVAFASLMSPFWALLYGISFVLGLAVYALAYYCVPADISLRSLKSIAFFVVVSIVASFASSLGSFVWSQFFNLDVYQAVISWKSWWTGMFLQSIVFVAPLLFLFSPTVMKIRKRYFSMPPEPNVSLKWIYSAITAVAVVLILFILSAKTLGSESLTKQLAGMSEETIGSLRSGIESFEIVAWISIVLVIITCVGGLYLVGRWNNKLKEKVDSQTENLKEKEELLKKAISDRDVLLNEIHDRVRNNLTYVLALLELQLKTDEEKPVKEILKDSHSRIRSMAIIHETMAHMHSVKMLNLKNYVVKLSNRLRHTHSSGEKNVEVKVDADELIINIDQAFPIALILNELMVNAYDHAFEGLEKGSIFVEIKYKNNQLLLSVRDNGIGLPKDFDAISQKTLGIKLVRTLAKQLHGEFVIEDHKRPSFSLKIPFNNNGETRQLHGQPQAGVVD